MDAPAKINLTLEVGNRREDGFHHLRSLMVPVDLCDELEITPSELFGFTCDDPSLDGEENLALRAFRAIFPEGAPLRLHLRKRIPSQAGLGGGSSDAAAILLAAMAGRFGPPGERDWLALARSLGSDVPFFLVQTGALVEGTGERVTPVGSLPAWQVVIVKPEIAISTAQAYAALDGLPRPPRARSDSVSLRALEALQRGDFKQLCELTQNDFEASVVPEHPSVARTLAALLAAGAPCAHLCGSGSACYALTQTRAQAQALRDRFRAEEHERVFLGALRSGLGWRSAS